MSKLMQQRIQLATGSGEMTSGIICTMTQRHLMQIETLWKNMLIEAAQADMDWNWDYKLRLATTDDRFEAYVVEQEDVVHGVVLIETQWHRSQLSDGGAIALENRSPLVYVEYLASAPWNRRTLEDPPFFTGIVGVLVSFARQRSINLDTVVGWGCIHYLMPKLFIADTICQIMAPIRLRTG